MSRRGGRLATLFVIAALGVGIFFLFKEAPAARVITYDLGDQHGRVVRLEVWITLEGDLVRHVQWFFEPGTAPRRISHEPTLPAEQFELSVEVEDMDGSVNQEHREMDWLSPEDVTYFLDTP